MYYSLMKQNQLELKYSLSIRMTISDESSLVDSIASSLTRELMKQ